MKVAQLIKDDVLCLYIARFFSLTASQVLFFAIPILIYTLTHSAFYSGLAFSLEWLARILSFPISGLNADKFGSKPVYIVADIGIALICLFALILITLVPQVEVVALMILSIVVGFLCEQDYVSTESLAPCLVSAEKYPKTQSVLGSLEQISLLLGPGMAGLFIIHFRLENLIILPMVFYLISGLLVIKLTAVPKQKKDSLKVSFFQDLLLGAKNIFKSRYLTYLILLAMLYNFLLSLIMSSAPIMTIGVFNKTDQFYAVMNILAGAIGVATIIGLNYLLRRFCIIKIGIYSFLVSCLLCMGFILLKNSLVYVLIFVMFYSADGLFAVFYRSERVRVIPQGELGRTIGATIFATFLLFPLSGLLVSLSEHIWGLQSMISIFGLVGLILGLPLLFKVNQIGLNIPISKAHEEKKEAIGSSRY